MASILLDVDGLLHVSGEPLPGAGEAVRALRRAGHRLRFVTVLVLTGKFRPDTVLASIAALPEWLEERAT
jgi:ribonucleotide monophosphatase NagD (HAD superfamily)